MEPIVLLTATIFEQDRVAQLLHQPTEEVVAGRRWLAGSLAGRQVLLVEGGLGAVNTAHALSCVLQRFKPVWVLQFGVGGAYPGAGLAVGDLAVASEENYGDIGVRTRAGWQSAASIGIPLWQGQRDYFNRFELEGKWADKAVAVLTAEQWSDVEVDIVAGPFVTVQEVSGTDELGAERRDRFNAVCESMEGAAAAHLCLMYGVPLVEIRAISNLVENRRREAWDLPLACRRAQEAAQRLAAVLDLEKL